MHVHVLFTAYSHGASKPSSMFKPDMLCGLHALAVKALAEEQAAGTHSCHSNTCQPNASNTIIASVVARSQNCVSCTHLTANGRSKNKWQLHTCSLVSFDCW